MHQQIVILDMTMEAGSSLLKTPALQNAAAAIVSRETSDQELLASHRLLEIRTRELGLSLSMMEAALQAVPDALLVVGRDFRVIRCNDNFVQMWGLSGEVVEGTDAGILLQRVSLHFAEPEEFVRATLRIAALQVPDTDVLKLQDGRILERHYHPQVFSGSVVGRVWCYCDVTQARVAEEELRDESRVLELLNRVGRSLTSKLDLRAVLQAATEAGAEISAAQFGAFAPTRSWGHEPGDLLETASGEVAAFSDFAEATNAALAQGRLAADEIFRCDELRLDSSAWGVLCQKLPRHGQLAPRSVLFVPVISRLGGVLGGLLFAHERPGVFALPTQRILTGIAAQAAVAIDNAQLHARVSREFEEQKLLATRQHDYLDRLQSLSRRLMHAEEHERRRLGRELHDRVGSNLSALLLGLALARNELPTRAQGPAIRLANLEETVRETMEHVRTVLADLRPTALDELGLAAALRHEAAALTGRTGVRFGVLGQDLMPRLPSDCEICFYRIAQEAWSNTLKHAGATQVVVTLAHECGLASMRIEELESLSKREREVLQLVAEGKSSAQIGKELFLSPKTVDTYRSRLMGKLGVGDVVSLVKVALQHGII